MKTFLTLAILSSLAAAPAMAESFTRDGQTYEYKITSLADAKLITGKVISTGQPFRLKVSGDRVSGYFASKSVRFRVAGAEATVRAASPLLASK